MRVNSRMRAVVCVLLIMVPSLLLAEDKKGPKPPTDIERLQGTWKVVSIEVNGNAEENEVGKTLTFDGVKFVLQGLEDAKFTLKLNPDKNPREFDLLDKEGKVFLKGIYKLDGNTLTACYANKLDDALKRPKEFSGAEGRNQVLLTAKKDERREK